eukprot:332187-Pyramimonas_sp.AAC.1
MVEGVDNFGWNKSDAGPLPLPPFLLDLLDFYWVGDHILRCSNLVDGDCGMTDKIVHPARR